MPAGIDPAFVAFDPRGIRQVSVQEWRLAHCLRKSIKEENKNGSSKRQDV